MEQLNNPSSVSGGGPQEARSHPDQLGGGGPVAALEEPMDQNNLEEESSSTPTSSSSAYPPFNGGEVTPSTTTQAATTTPSPPELSSTSSPHQFAGNPEENGRDHQSPSPPQGAESSTASPPCPEEPVAGASTSSPPPSPSEDFEEMPQNSSGSALADLLVAVENYEPTIPDGVTNYLLTQAGFQSEDPRLARLLSLATQKFISDVVNESFTICKLKGQVTNLNQQAKAKLKEKKYSLTLEDLGPVLSDNGITVKKPPYYT